MSTKAQIAKMVMVTAEVMGTELSDAAIEMFVSKLGAYRLDQIGRAIDRVMTECKGRLTLADIISRISTGHPGPEEAWAIAKPTIGNEHVTVVWTPQIAAAAAIANNLASDPIAARMAFLEAYRGRSVDHEPPQWEVCEGYDPNGRYGPIADAVQKGLITASAAVKMLPARAPQLLALADNKPAELTDRTDERHTPPEGWSELLEDLRSKYRSQRTNEILNNNAGEVQA